MIVKEKEGGRVGEEVGEGGSLYKKENLLIYVLYELVASYRGC